MRHEDEMGKVVYISVCLGEFNIFVFFGLASFHVNINERCFR